MASCVAVLSDVHGVLPVLEAVLAEPEVVSADLVVVTGTTRPGRCRWRRSTCWRPSRPRPVRGNAADRELVAVARGGTSEHPESVWAASQLRRDQVALLEALPHPVTLPVDGFGPVLFCHGSPRRRRSRARRHPAGALGRGLRGPAADVQTVVCGHTHMPFVRLVDRRLVLNPGSVGMPYGRPGGAWALLRDGQVSLRHTPLDTDAVCERIVAESAYPERAAWVDEYVRSRNSDADAVTAFAPRDGRFDT